MTLTVGTRLGPYEILLGVALTGVYWLPAGLASSGWLSRPGKTIDLSCPYQNADIREATSP
jgi:hypothetical protein